MLISYIAATGLAVNQITINNVKAPGWSTIASYNFIRYDAKTLSVIQSKQKDEKTPFYQTVKMFNSAASLDL